MSKTTRIVIVALIALFFGGVMLSKMPKNGEGKIDVDAKYAEIDPDKLYKGEDLTVSGGIGDHVKGRGDAEVIIYEYADYQCPGCALANTWINDLVEEYDGKVGLVYRVYLLSWHENARAAASAVEAAGLQGYWKQYSNLMFANQSEWETAGVSERGELFEKYFAVVSDNLGDMEKFRKDMVSQEVSDKIDFDVAMAKKKKLEATPALYVDGELIDWYDQTTKSGFLNFLRGVIDKKLAE